MHICRMQYMGDKWQRIKMVLSNSSSCRKQSFTCLSWGLQEYAPEYRNKLELSTSWQKWGSTETIVSVFPYLTSNNNIVTYLSPKSYGSSFMKAPKGSFHFKHILLMSYSTEQLDNIYFFLCFQRKSYQAILQSNFSQYNSKFFLMCHGRQ